MQDYDVEPSQLPGYSVLRFADGRAQTVPNTSQMVAQRAPGTGLAESGATAQLAPWRAVPTTPQEFVTQEGPAPAPPQTAQDFSEKWGGQQAPSAQQSAQATQAQAPAAQQYVPTEQDKLVYDLRSPYKFSSPTAPFKPREYAASLVPVPTGRHEAVQGQKEFDPEAQQKIQAKELEARNTIADADALHAINKAQTELGMAREIQGVVQQQQVQQQADERDFNVRMTALEDESKALANRQINPNRIFENMQTWKKVTFGAAAVLGGMANPHGPNQALQFINTMVDRDILAQEQQLRSGQNRVDNALGRLAHQWGSIQLGKAALRVQQLEAAKQFVVAQGAASGVPADLKRIQGVTQAFQAEQAKYLEELRVASKGQRTSQEQQAMMAPRAGSAGGWVRKSLAERARDEGLAEGIQGSVEKLNAAVLANIEKRNKITGVNGPELKAPQVAAIRHYGDQMAALSDIDHAISQIIALNKIQTDASGSVVSHDVSGKNLGYQAANFLVGDPTVFGPKFINMLKRNFSGPDAERSAHLESQLLDAIRKEATGVVFKPEELEAIKTRLGQDTLSSPQSFAQAMADVKGMIERKKAALKAGLGKPLLDVYHNSARQIAEGENASKTGVLGYYGGTDDAPNVDNYDPNAEQGQ